MSDFLLWLWKIQATGGDCEVMQTNTETNLKCFVRLEGISSTIKSVLDENLDFTTEFHPEGRMGDVSNLHHRPLFALLLWILLELQEKGERYEKINLTSEAATKDELSFSLFSGLINWPFGL